ncbi:MAG: 30S ribosome-binding factor RbfA [Firmicutes bacterium]|jgi:ribosome-binding factor A|nr:30S ribosome-binding factor RbfA [Candidatus Fermentithermobacillaceae bacterium]
MNYGVMLVSQRAEKIAASIREIVSELLLRRLKDPRIGFASVVNVEVNRDLSIAKIYVSVLGSEEEKARTMEGLKSAQGLVRTEVSKALGIRQAPEIQFVLDKGIEHSLRVSQIISELKASETESEQEELDAEDAEEPEAEK